MPGHRHRRHGPPDGGIAHLTHARGRLLMAQEGRLRTELLEERTVSASRILGDTVVLTLPETPSEAPESHEDGTTDPTYDDGETIHRGLE